MPLNSLIESAMLKIDKLSKSELKWKINTITENFPEQTHFQISLKTNYGN